MIVRLERTTPRLWTVRGVNAGRRCYLLLLVFLRVAQDYEALAASCMFVDRLTEGPTHILSLSLCSFYLRDITKLIQKLQRENTDIVLQTTCVVSVLPK